MRDRADDGALYPELVRAHRDERLTFAECRIINLDEYVGLRPDDPRSYHAYMDEHLLESVDLGPRSTFLPDGTAAGLGAEARRYEERIVRVAVDSELWDRLERLNGRGSGVVSVHILYFCRSTNICEPAQTGEAENSELKAFRAFGALIKRITLQLQMR